ncbi:hypothetical protein ACWF76_14865 [Streptomyces globisporus]
MSDELPRQLAEYDQAVDIAGSTYPEMSRDERGARELAGRQLALHNAAVIDPAHAAPAPAGARSSLPRPRGFIAADVFRLDTVLGKRLYVRAFLEHGTRRLRLTGDTAHPAGQWAVQQARNLAADFGTRMEFLRDTKYTDAFDAVFQSEDVDVSTNGGRRRPYGNCGLRDPGGLHQLVPDDLVKARG